MTVILHRAVLQDLTFCLACDVMWRCLLWLDALNSLHCILHLSGFPQGSLFFPLLLLPPLSFLFPCSSLLPLPPLSPAFSSFVALSPVPLPLVPLFSLPCLVLFLSLPLLCLSFFSSSLLPPSSPFPFFFPPLLSPFFPIVHLVVFEKHQESSTCTSSLWSYGSLPFSSQRCCTCGWY